MDDFVIQVRQIAQYPQITAVGVSDALLVQQTGIGGPYTFIQPKDLFASALINGGPLNLKVGANIAWNGATQTFDGSNFVFNKPLSVPSIQSAGDIFVAGHALATQVNVEAQLNAILNNSVFSFNFRTGNIQLTTDDVLRAGGAPISNAHFGGFNTSPTPWDFRANSDQIATTQWVQMVITQLLCGGSVVTSFNSRGGAVTLTTDDVNAAFAANATVFPYPAAPTPPFGDASTRIATTMFVDQSIEDLRWWVDQQDYVIQNELGSFAPINSPAFTGVPTGPTALTGNSTAQLATTAFVHAAVVAATTGVASFNTRTGAVVLTTADLASVGGAPIANPSFTGVPLAPTATAGTSSQQIATTAFVTTAITAGTAGVASFNTRTGAVVLTATDVTASGALANTALTGTPTAPTATSGTNTTQLATTAFVAAAIALAPGGVSSFNTRTGAITLLNNDITAAGGVVAASPAFTGAPTAPTAVVGTNTTQIATTAFVLAQIAVSGGVNTFNGRAGVVVLNATDIFNASGALYAQADTAPVLTNNGTLWFDSIHGQLYVRYVDPSTSAPNWVIANTPPPPAQVPIPTARAFFSGSGTYTPPAGVAWIRVRMCAGGGGGGAGGPGQDGSTTSFGGWTTGGGGGGNAAAGASGGTPGSSGTGGSNGSGTLVARIAGMAGANGTSNTDATAMVAAMAAAGSSPLGSYGCGGYGGYAQQATVGNSGGGGAGEYVEFFVAAPTPTAWTAGAFGAAGGGNAWVANAINGGPGVIIIEEHY